MYQKCFYFFIFNYEVVIDCPAFPSFFFKFQVFCLFAFTHTETCALKLKKSTKYLCDVSLPLGYAGMLQSHNNKEMESLQVSDFRYIWDRQSMQQGTLAD